MSLPVKVNGRYYDASSLNVGFNRANKIFADYFNQRKLSLCLPVLIENCIDIYDVLKHAIGRPHLTSSCIAYCNGSVKIIKNEEFLRNEIFEMRNFSDSKITRGKFDKIHALSIPYATFIEENKSYSSRKKLLSHILEADLLRKYEEKYLKKLSKGLHDIQDLFKFAGISQFERDVMDKGNSGRYYPLIIGDAFEGSALIPFSGYTVGKIYDSVSTLLIDALAKQTFNPSEVLMSSVSAEHKYKSKRHFRTVASVH